jgi:uncharacterized protein YqhQ
MPEGEYLQYGGQAIVEGVMMRSPHYFAVACRAPNGEVVSQVEAISKTWIGKQKWLKLPFLRGSLAILDAMTLGSQAMRFASNIQLDPAYQPPDKDGTPTAKPVDAPLPKRVQDVGVGLAMFAGLAIGILLFVVLPNVVAEWWHRAFNTEDYRYTNLVTEFIKVALFLGYVYGIGRIPEIGRVYKYHGAEHKAINTLEANEPLELENCLRQTRLHPRCGTSFAIIVLILSLLLFTFVPRYPFGQWNPAMGPDPNPVLHNVALQILIRVVLEILILPLVAGFAYEAIRIAGKFRNASLIRALFWPGLMTQYLTTKEPEEGQIEVALTSLKMVVEAEQNHSSPGSAVIAG